MLYIRDFAFLSIVRKLLERPLFSYKKTVHSFVLKDSAHNYNPLLLLNVL